MNTSDQLKNDFMLSPLTTSMHANSKCGTHGFGVLKMWTKSGTGVVMQIAFTCVVYPCLLLGYIGQAAYLSKNLDDVSHGFYNSIPSEATSMTHF
jgi:hypothetical protein